MAVLTLALCARLSWLLVSFQVHISHIIIIITDYLHGRARVTGGSLTSYVTPYWTAVFCDAAVHAGRSWTVPTPTPTDCQLSPSPATQESLRRPRHWASSWSTNTVWRNDFSECRHVVDRSLASSRLHNRDLDTVTVYCLERCDSDEL